MAFVAFGLKVETDFNFDSLPESTHSDSSAILTVERRTSLPQYGGRLLQEFVTGTRTVRVFRNGPGFVYVLDDLVSFELEPLTKEIHCFLCGDASEDLFRYWLLHRILPIYRMMDGSHIFLHAAAVSLQTAGPDQSPRCDDGCLAFFGPSYAGKSTMVSYFLSMGHSLVTDDHLAIAANEHSGPVRVAPATPCYRPYRAVEDLGLTTESFCTGVLPLQQLYVLQPTAPDATIRMERLDPFEVVSLLLEDLQYSIHEAKVPEFLSVIERRFRGFSHVARQVPTWRLHVPRSLDRLPEVYQYIQNNLQNGRPS
jgi:hypothetical protein